MEIHWRQYTRRRPRPCWAPRYGREIDHRSRAVELRTRNGNPPRNRPHRLGGLREGRSERRVEIFGGTHPIEKRRTPKPRRIVLHGVRFNLCQAPAHNLLSSPMGGFHQIIILIAQKQHTSTKHHRKLAPIQCRNA